MFTSYHLHHHYNMYMSWDHRQSLLKALLNTYGMCCKTHGMVIRYRSPEKENIITTKDSFPLNLVPQEHPTTEGDNESSGEYSEETDTCHPLAKLLEQFCQLKNQIASLNSTAPQSTSTDDLSQLSNKLQHLTMVLQPAPSPVRSQHTKPFRHTKTPSTKHRIQPHQKHAPGYSHIWWTRLLKIRRLVHGHRNCCWHHKRELHMPGWGQITWPHLHTHLQGHPNRKVLGWHQRHYKIKNCNATIHTYTSHFMDIYKKYNETWAAYIHHFKTRAELCAFDNDTAAICIFVKALQDAPTIVPEVYEKDP